MPPVILSPCLDLTVSPGIKTDPEKCCPCVGSLHFPVRCREGHWQRAGLQAHSGPPFLSMAAASKKSRENWRKGQHITYHVLLGLQTSSTPNNVRSTFQCLVNFLFQFWENQWTWSDKWLYNFQVIKVFKQNEGLWKNIRVANGDSKIPRKADYCLLPHVPFTWHLKIHLFRARSTYSFLCVWTLSWPDSSLYQVLGEEKTNLMSGHEHILSSTEHRLAHKLPLCKKQGIGEWTLVAAEINESPGKSRILVILL